MSNILLLLVVVRAVAMLIPAQQSVAGAAGLAVFVHQH
jgi:hypothetical protein